MSYPSDDEGADSNRGGLSLKTVYTIARRFVQWTLALCGLLATCLADGVRTESGPDLKTLEAMHAAACALPDTGDSQWHIRSLYDCETKTLYVPYQLWTGARWDGDRTATCMHEADSRFVVNGVSATVIVGPVEWTNPETRAVESIWRRDKENGSKSQYFVCHETGIGRVYDSRGPWSWAPGRCKFPAGPGWKIGQRRHCRGTSIEIIGVSVAENGTITDLWFKWWYGATLDHVYRYVPNIGMTHAWPQ